MRPRGAQTAVVRGRVYDPQSPSRSRRLRAQVSSRRAATYSSSSRSSSMLIVPVEPSPPEGAP